MQDEQHVERSGERGIGFVVRLGDLPHHRQEVLGEGEFVVGVDEGHPQTEAVAGGGERRHLGDQAHDLPIADLGILDLLRVVVERRQRSDGRDQHPHRMSVVVEPLEKALAHVLVDERVVRDVLGPHLVLFGGRELAVDQQVGDLEVGRLFGELLDRIAAVSEDALLAVDVGDGTRRRGRRRERGVVEPGVAEEFSPLRAGDAAVFDRDLDRLAGSVVGDGHAVSHERNVPEASRPSVSRRDRG